MAVEWTKLVEKCDRKFRYVTNNYAKKTDEIVMERCSYIEKVLEMFNKEEQSIQCILESMENSDDPSRSADTIDDYKSQFDQIIIQVTSKLRDAIAEKTPRSEKSEQGEGSFHTSQSISASTQIKFCKKQISDIDTKLKALKTFNNDYDTSNPPSTTIMNFQVNKIVQLHTQSDEIFASLHSMLTLEDEIKLHDEMQVQFNQQFESELSVLLDRQSNAVAADRIVKFESHVKIESIKIQEFNGNPTAWPTFRDKFKALIHESPKFSKVAKFTYLDSYIKDKHAPASLRAPATEASYDNVWKDVCNQYDNNRILLRCLFDDLLKVKNMSDATENEMKRVKNEIQSICDSLKLMKDLSNLFDALIAHIALYRVDNYSRDLFETICKDKVPVWNELSEFLDQRRRTMANCSSITKVQTKSTTKTSTNHFDAHHFPGGE